MCDVVRAHRYHQLKQVVGVCTYTFMKNLVTCGTAAAQQQAVLRIENAVGLVFNTMVRSTNEVNNIGAYLRYRYFVRGGYIIHVGTISGTTYLVRGGR